MSNMKMKKLFAILLASSLASTASSSASELEDRYEDQYYVGLNFGAGWGDIFKMKPNVVFGYNYDKNSKFELEVLANISDITDKQKRKVGASLLANYRFYPDLNIDPVRLYSSVGLGGYLQVVPFGFGISDTADDNGDGDRDQAPQKVPQFADEPNKDDGADKAADSSLVDKILSSISYKVKLGVDYEITPQIIGTAGMTMGGQLSSFKPPLQIPDAMLEVGIRYNF